MNKKHHSIIEKPWEYRIIDFRYFCDSNDFSEHYIDMKLKKDPVTRNLRFIAPRDLAIEKGFPYSTSGMEILDISENQLENVNVEVGDFEATMGSITFYAKRVIDLDKAGF